MEVSQLIQSLMGTIVGGSIVIAANWLTNQWSRKKDAQEWYDKTYISEGIDPLLAYFVYLDNHFDELINRSEEKKEPILLENIDPIPSNALTRVSILLDGLSPMWIIEGTIRNINDGDRYFIFAYREIIKEAIQILTGMRRELIKTIQKKVKNKSYQLDMPHIIDNLRDLENKVYTIAIEREEKEEEAERFELAWNLYKKRAEMLAGEKEPDSDFIEFAGQAEMIAALRTNGDLSRLIEYLAGHSEFGKDKGSISYLEFLKKLQTDNEAFARFVEMSRTASQRIRSLQNLPQK